MERQREAKGKAKKGGGLLGRVLLLALAAGLMAAGLYRGEVWLVFQKAIRICLECIGIG